MARPNHIFRKIRKGSQAEKLVEALIARPQKSECRSIETVQELRDSGLGLVVECTGCKAEHFYQGEEMIEAFGAQTSIKEVQPTCTSCDKQSVNVMPKKAA